MEFIKAQEIAQRHMAEMAPHCERIAIAGSIRRRKAFVNDIEIVAIPKPYETGLFSSGLAAVVDWWEKVRGDLLCRYTSRKLPEGIELDLFFATKTNWGLIFAIRTGSADYSHHVLATGWSLNGYKSQDGLLRDSGGFIVPVPEEEDLFRLAGVRWIRPDLREYAVGEVKWNPAGQRTGGTP